MTIIELHNPHITTADTRLSKIYAQFGALLNELRKRALAENILQSINASIEQINTSTLTGKHLIKLIKQKETAILKQLEKELKLVTKNYYRNLWMLFGISAFGLPIGVAFGISMGNIGLLGIGIPIGMGIGLAVGSSLDKKALKEGRQLDIEMKN